MIVSPFQTTRFEYAAEGQHQYFLPRALVDVLEPPKPVYIIGTRGTGKTTLLKALNWKERLNNISLCRQLGNDSFAKRYIGVYLKLPAIQLSAFDTRLAKESRELRSLIVSLYLDIIGLQLIVDAIAEMIAQKIITASPKDEQECTDAIIEGFAGCFLSIDPQLLAKNPITLKHLIRVFRQMQSRLERYAIYGGDALIAVENYSGQIGELGRSVSDKLAELCNSSVHEPMKKWHFKICMDEGEALSNDHQLILNTIVRLSKWPLFHLVSFVERPHDMSNTLISNLTVSDADCNLVLLDKITDKEFRILGEGVVTVRVQDLMKDYSVTFNVRSCLGKLSINKLAMSVLQESASEKAKKLLEISRKKIKDPFFCELMRDQSIPLEEESVSTEATENAVDSRILPIYETYLVEKLKLKLPTPDDPKWAKRAQESAEIRKKMVAAYLSICSEIGADVRYASADMVLQMSDKCIRDFLNFTHGIFLESKCDLRSFIKGPIPIKTQDKAIKLASRHKRATLKESGILAPTEAARIIDALAEITAYIQTNSHDMSHLEATERGLFTLDLKPKEREIFASVFELIRDAARAGYFMISQEGESKWIFRVHTSLAAAYGFSYRGAYYETPLIIRELDDLRQCSDLEVFKKAVKKIEERLAGWKDKIGPLFSGQQDDNDL